ncbi:MAG: hypothetical protein HYR70_04460 [Chloroflexi bacterium]|nr:hypothetical protein [Chloroflexota bacterium]MBI3340809.1 hypothetical protein [Chloroflexota bacterium]
MSNLIINYLYRDEGNYKDHPMNTARLSFPWQRPLSLHRAIAGRDLTGILVDDGNLLLRFSDAMVVVDLSTRAHRFQPVLATWITFPGWLRIARVIEDQSQVILVVSGALFTARIVIRHINNEWRMILQGGRILAPN